MEQQLTFEKVWSLFKETDRRFKETDRGFQELRELIKENDLKAEKRSLEFEKWKKESSEEFEKWKKRSSEEFENWRKESSADFDRRMKKHDRKIRELEKLFTGQWGKLMESLVEGDLVALLNARGIAVNQTQQRQKKVYNNQHFEIDIVARNGTEVVFVEIKTTLVPKHIDNFVEKLEIIKSVFPEYSNNTIYGAIAFLRSESESILRAERKGLFVIRATGKSASIVNSPDFKPNTF